jgi:hypothetical protein
MTGPDVMFPEEQQQMSMVCARLARDANAKAVLLIGATGSRSPTPATSTSWT